MRQRPGELALTVITAVVAVVTIGIELILLMSVGNIGHEPSALDHLLYGLAAVLGGLSLGLAIVARGTTTTMGFAAYGCTLLAVTTLVFAIGAPVWFPGWYGLE